MELFGIVLSVPFGFVLALGYCALLKIAVLPRKTLARVLRVGGVVVLCALAIELVLLGLWGPSGCRSRLGVGFWVGHSAVFLLGTPALANVLVLRRKDWVFSRSPVAAACCSVIFFGLVLLQYFVSEALFGVD